MANKRNYQKEMEKIISGFQGERKRLFLHSCCAPCSSAVLEQLQEIKFVTPELLEWFKLGDGVIRKLNINKDGLDKLRAHPYVNFYQAKVIVEHRRKRGQIKSLSQLSLYEEFTEKDLVRLANYFSFD